MNNGKGDVTMMFSNARRIEKNANKQIEVEKARMKAMNVLTNLELEKLENESRLQPEVDRITTLKANLESKRTLQEKAWTYRLSANSLNVISALMTISGIAGTSSLFDLEQAFTGNTGIFACTTALLQLVVMNINKRDYEIKQNHFVDYKKIALFKGIVIGISMVGNYKYMAGIMPHSLFYNMVSIAVAFCLDNGACYLSNLATNVKYRNYTNDTTSKGNMTRLDKFLKLVSNKLFGWIDKEYNKVFGAGMVAGHEEQKPEVTSSKHKASSVSEPKKKQTKAQVNYDTVMKQIATMKSGEVISKDTFGLSQYDWKNVRERLDSNNIVECRNKKTYIL